MEIADYSLRGLEIMVRAGVKMGFGTDLMGILYADQCREFALRRRVLPALDILRSATSVNAELMQLGSDLGRIVDGALADLVVIDGDPFTDINLLAQDGRHLSLIMKDGRIHRSSLA